MNKPQIAILHYTAPPVVGGVEAVIQAHAQIFVQAGYPVTVVAGWGEAAALPEGTSFIRIPEMDSQYAQITQLGEALEQGMVPRQFEEMANQLMSALASVLNHFDTVIIHNVLTKHFNLPLTAALFQLLEAGVIQHGIAWCHDFTWTSPSSGSKVHPGSPWDLLRTRRPDVTYVVVSQRRQQELAGLFGCTAEEIRVIYNGVDPQALLGLSPEGAALVERLGLLEQDLVLLMPVRVTQAKNIEYALRVVAALRVRGCRLRLLLTGPPDPHDTKSMAYFRSLQALRRELDVEEEMRFVFESGSDPDEPYLIEAGIVGDLFRVSDLMFMPSHREGFAMPVLEAGLAGIPVVCTKVPAAVEIGGEDVILFDHDEAPDRLAARLLAWAEGSPMHRLRRRVRQGYTWQAIFRRDIEPLLYPRGRAKAGTSQDVERQIAQAERLWLFLDYDGTLADFAPTPEHVKPDPELVDLIERLVRHPRFHMAVVSGRRLSHVQKLVPVPGVLLAGTYGIELQTPEGVRIDRLDYDRLRPTLDALKPQWAVLVAGRQGFFLEDKGWALALHARFAGEDEAAQVLADAHRLADAAVEQAEPELFRLLGGHKFLEIGPRLANKGLTVAHLLDEYPWPGAVPLYLGDDDKDEEAFGTIKARGGIAVIVALEPRETKADLRLESPQAARRWLEMLLIDRG